MNLAVLIVDDSHLMCEMTKDFLKKSEINAAIYTRSSGKEAIEFIEKHAVDVLVLDILMPEMSGEAVMLYLSEHQYLNKMKVIIFSSLSEQHYLKGFFEMGAFDFITKPLHEEEFIARVKNALNDQMLQRQLYQTIEVIKDQNQTLEDLNQQLKSSQMMIIQQEQLAGIGHLAAGVAHEINNPLGYIISNMNVLQGYAKQIEDWHKNVNHMITEIKNHSETYEPVQQWVRGIERCSKETDIAFVLGDLTELLDDTFNGLERVRKIVKGLRLFSRIDLGQEFESYNLNEGIENTLIVTRNEIKYATEVEVIYGAVPEIPAVGGEINQTLLNLVINAVSAIKARHTPDKGMLSICSYLEKNYVCCVVKDNGMGIEEKNINDIFKPFFTTKPVGEGTGLGLSISYDIIVNKHKGILDVQTVYGEGTTMTIKLPVER